MDDNLKMALYIGLGGFAVMIIASIALWVFRLPEAGCCVIMAVGVIAVIVAMIYASYPQLFDRFRKKEEPSPAEESEETPSDEQKE